MVLLSGLPKLPRRSLETVHSLLSFGFGKREKGSCQKNPFYRGSGDFSLVAIFFSLTEAPLPDPTPTPCPTPRNGPETELKRSRTEPKRTEIKPYIGWDSRGGGLSGWRGGGCKAKRKSLEILEKVLIVENKGGSYHFLSETGRIRFRRVRFQTPNSVSFLGLTEFRGANSASSSRLIICVPKRTHRVFRRTHRVCRRTQ